MLAIAITLILLTKLYFLQIIHGGDFIELANHQYVPSSNVFDRGTIYFQTKEGEDLSAATLQTGYTLAVNPKVLVSAERAYSEIAATTTLQLVHDDFIAKATKANDSYEELAKHVSQADADRIKGLGLKGVSLYVDKWRSYPGDTLAAQAIGFVGYDGNVLTGRAGLERYYNDVLGRSGQSVHQNFFAELFSDINTTISDNSNRAGDIVTTIEPTVQAQLEAALAQTEKTWSSQLSGGVIIDPNTGEIYAMAVNPTYDPNTYGQQKDPAVFTNNIVESRYEMGSIIKPLTVAAGIDSGAITPATTYDDTGCIVLNTKKICNFDHVARGVIPMQQILSQSLNVGASWVALKMGSDVFTKYFKSYGLGSETGIDLPGEIHGDIANLESKRDVEHATASFGQGIAITPIETVRALSALANGGLLINPHVVKQINYQVGLSKTVDFGDEPRVLQKTTTDALTKMLVEVVDKALAKGAVALPHWSIAAKTGTAQIANPAGGGYYADKYLHSFFGYFPAYNPRFLIFLYTVQPQNVNYASQTLTSPFINLAKFMIHYYDIPPDR